MNQLSARLVLVVSVPIVLTLASGCWASHGREARALGRDAGPAIDAHLRRDAAASPDAASLPDAGCASPLERYFEPGCGGSGEVRIEPGCHQPCDGPDDASCGPGRACRRTDINPCICPPGGDCCGACGAEQWLCLAPPVPTGCEGRTYCECVEGCVPLIDLTHGCVCPCDEPFRCGGPPCDCACGGAQYLGCAAPDACTVTEVTCGSDAIGGLVDGCPECVGGI